ncbi:tripartite tricarboxylate transporter substrate-binding protein [Humitalea sp. 24SJ18S-53]|uniref:tripartite tricarboxylate transporter substrate-binding protein n=1 Tax=Humitalea sp. 24SJ18S-53 TaxID=3422307 RepID=UPI003D673ED4
MTADSFFDGARLRSRYRLSGRGLPLVLVHGVGSDLEDLDAVAERLGDGFRILRYDLRGHGQSERVPGPYDLADFAADLVELMDHVGFAQADVMGFSLGALITQRLALDYPNRTRRLAMVSGVSGRSEQERAAVLVRLQALESREPTSHAEASVSRWFTDAFQAAHPEVVANRKRRIASNHKPSYAAAYRVLATSDLADELPRITQPTLVMTGECDQGSNPRMARLMHDRIAGSELHILPDLRHSILLEAPDLVAEKLRAFLLRSSPAGVARRAVLTGAVGLLAARRASAQAYPDRPIRLVVPFAPGGGTDLIARVIADGMASVLGQPVVVENRGGAGTIIGTDFVAKSAPDGYTLLYSGLGLTFQPGMNRRLPYDVIADFAPVSVTGRQPNILIVNPALRFTGVQDLVRRAKAEPGKFSFGTAGQGSGTHIASEMLWQTLGVDMLHVPYRGTAPALNDLMGGRLDAMFTTISSVAGQVRGGSIPAIGMSSLQRSPLLPDVATIREQGFGDYEYSNWAAIVAPANTPRPIVDRLAAAIAHAMTTQAVRDRLAGEGVIGDPEGPDAATALYRSEVARWTPLIRQMGIEMN